MNLKGLRHMFSLVKARIIKGCPHHTHHRDEEEERKSQLPFYIDKNLK